MWGFESVMCWYPPFSFACYRAGARKFTTCDLNPHLREDLARACVDELEKFLPVIAEAAGADPDAVAQRYHALRERTRGGEEPTAASGGVIDYHAPADAASTALGDGEVDVVFSNSVLEHRSEEHTSELQSLMRTSYAVFCLQKKKYNRRRKKQQ